MPARWGIAFALGVATAAPLAARTASAEAGSAARPVSAEIGIEWAVGTRDGESQKLQLSIEPQLDLALPGNFQLKGIGRLRADAFDELEPGQPDQPEVAPWTRRLGFGDRVDAELRELFVQGRIGPAWLRIGKQQVVWGQADGLKVLDVVDPQNWDEFILPVFEDSRIPLWTVDVEVPIDDAQLQLLWIPDTTAHDIPPSDGLFAFTAPRLVGERPPPGVPVRVEAAEHPDDTLQDSDVGARLSGFWKGWDLTANALWHYDDIPIPFRTIEFSAGGPQVRVAPGFERTAVLGGTASTAYGNLTVRGEMAAHLDRWFPTDDATDQDGVVRTTDVGWVLGLDWYGFSETLLSAQLFQSFLTDHRPGVIRDRLDTNVTVLARRTFRHETLTLETIWIQSINDGDGLVRPRVEYAVRDDLQVWMGFDVFYGTRDGIYGEFDENDRFVIGFEWGL